jgi:arsenate reductase
MIRILFLCTGNSCRSQMAEGWTRALKGGRIEAFSAGIETHGLNPRAVQVMAEAGVDISGHTSKTVADLPSKDFDYVVTVCDHAHESCPLFPGNTKVVHVGFDDPPRLAQDAETEEEALAHYRRVRDEIRAFVETLPEGLKERRGRDALPYPTAAAPPTPSGRANPPGEPGPLLPQRKKLPHETPSLVKQGARHFITISCKQRTGAPLLQENNGNALLESAAFYEQLGHWYMWLMVIMPDHLHFIATFNLNREIQDVIKAWKSHQAKHLGIQWQSGFFEHRLRNNAELDEKSHYIRWNPVRKGLVTSPDDWPFVLDRIVLGRANPPGEPKSRLGKDASPYPTALSQSTTSGRANPPGEPKSRLGKDASPYPTALSQSTTSGRANPPGEPRKKEE